MLTRLYVDNYKAFVNFELRLTGHALLLGANGAGKSSLLEVLELLRHLLINGEGIEDSVGLDSVTRWDQRDMQTFEIEATDGTMQFAYRLVLENSVIPEVQEESLSMNGMVRFQRKGTEGEIQLKEGASNIRIIVDSARSAVPMLSRRQGFREFSSLLERVLVIRPEPRLMHARTESEDQRLVSTLENFASWWRLLWQEQPEALVAALANIAEILPGFRSMSIQRVREDELRMLTTHWDVGEPGGKSVLFKLHELSDGQRVLIALQCASAWLSIKGGTLVIDEPDNFLALAEIQPFLRGLLDAPNLQLIVASHHPEVLNDLAREYGIRLWRDRGGPVRQERFVMPSASGLSPAEHIAARLDVTDG